jgi:hypothetical protein
MIALTADERDFLLDDAPGTGHVEEAWPEPRPIQIALQPVESLLVEIIPEPFREWLTDIANRMQCPLDFVAVSAIIEAGAVIGAGCGIHPKRYDDWRVIPNLWGGVIARPSKLKSPALAEAMKPMSTLETEAKRTYDEELAFFEADQEVFKAKKDALKSDMSAAAKCKKVNGTVPDMGELRQEYTNLEAPKASTRHRFKTNDATVEKIAELLNENPRGILMFRDELVGLLVSWDREDRQSDRAFYLEAWNGYGGYTTDRIGRGTIDTQNLCVSILGGIQPSKLTGYLLQANDDLKNDGLLQRFQLLVYPNETDWKLVDKHPNIEARDRVYGVFKSLSEMDFTQHGAELLDGENIPFFNFSDDAQQVFYDWLTDLEATKIKNEGNPLMAEHLSKYRSLMPSLALIFHLINISDGQLGCRVTRSAAEQAAAWCEYLESHARRIYVLLVDVSVRSAEELAKRIQGKELSDGFTPRDVYRNGWHLLDSKELTQNALNELLDAGWLRESITVEGKTRAQYYINPKKSKNFFLHQCR